jgi:tetratricopeptide (TPR) repeat protein
MSAIEISNTDLPATTCLKCGSTDVVKNVPNPLCIECRTAAIKFPIPLWVKIFGACILLLVIFSLINLPQSLTLGLSLERGIAAEQQHKFVTAQRYFTQAINLDSNNTEANEHLMIASFYNYDMMGFIQSGNRIAGKTLDDDDLLERVNRLANKTNYYFPSDSFSLIQQQFASADAIPDSVYINYIKQNTDNMFEETMFASLLFDRKDYHRCDSLCHIILDTDDENFAALYLMGSAKRFENQADSAVYYCDRMIAMNNELTYARCLKARALLKLKRNDEAMQLVMDCKNADSTSAYTLATLALVYHSEHNAAKRDAVLSNAEKKYNDSANAEIFQYVHDVINNKEPL